MREYLLKLFKFLGTTYLILMVATGKYLIGQLTMKLKINTIFKLQICYLYLLPKALIPTFNPAF